MSLSPELSALRDEAMVTSCEAWAIQKHWVLSRGIDRSGPCPVCGGEDRFSIHTKQNIFNCRQCGIAGEGVIKLVMLTENVPFAKACEIITGRSASDPVDAERAAELRRRAEADRSKRDGIAAAQREKARRGAYDLWRGAHGLPPGMGPVRAYLALRACDIDLMHDPLALQLREYAKLPWREASIDEHGGKTWSPIHNGPAMVACVQMPDGRFGASHVTWLDLMAPKGRLVLPAADDGRARPSKKVFGSKKGGAIRLYTPAFPSPNLPGELQVSRPHRMVMGEGIETTLTALCHAYEPLTAYWAGVDLGNMSGRVARDAGGHIHYDQPDMEDRDCFVPPDWVDELVYLGEGDEPRVHSAEKCIAGLRRAKRLRDEARQTRPELAPLRIVYVPAGEPGKDLNDIAMADMAELGPQGVGRADALAADRTELGEEHNAAAAAQG